MTLMGMGCVAATRLMFIMAMYNTHRAHNTSNTNARKDTDTRDNISSINLLLLLYMLYMEHRVRFELTVLGICNPLRWAAPPPVHHVVGGEYRTLSLT